MRLLFLGHRVRFFVLAFWNLPMSTRLELNRSRLYYNSLLLANPKLATSWIGASEGEEPFFILPFPFNLCARLLCFWTRSKDIQTSPLLLIDEWPIIPKISYSTKEEEQRNWNKRIVPFQTDRFFFISREKKSENPFFGIVQHMTPNDLSQKLAPSCSSRVIPPPKKKLRSEAQETATVTVAPLSNGAGCYRFSYRCPPPSRKKKQEHFYSETCGKSTRDVGSVEYFCWHR